MSVCPFRDKILDYHEPDDGPLPDDVARHLAECSECRQLARLLARIEDDLVAGLFEMR